MLVEDDEATLLELTIPHNSTESISNAIEPRNIRKKIIRTLSDLEQKGFNSYLLTIEIMRHCKINFVVITNIVCLHVVYPMHTYTMYISPLCDTTILYSLDNDILTGVAVDRVVY